MLKLRSQVGRVENGDALLVQSLASVPVWLAAMWDAVVESPPLTVVYAATAEGGDMQSLVASGRPRYDPARLPIATLTQADIRERTTGPYHAWQMQTFGIDLQPRPLGDRARAPRDVARRAYLRPVSVGLGVQVRCASIEEGRVFCSLWLQHLPNFCYDIQDVASKAQFRIHLTPEPAITQPQIGDGNGPQGTTLTYETTLIVDTFVGRIETANVIKKVDVNVNLDQLVRAGRIVIRENGRQPPLVEFEQQ